jgi:hypothetical protein
LSAVSGEGRPAVAAGVAFAYARDHAAGDRIMGQRKLAMNTERVSYSKYPIWVKLSLWGVPGRKGLWGMVALSIGCAIGCLLYGGRDARFYTVSPVFVLAAVPYWLSIRWIDRRGSWERPGE